MCARNPRGLAATRRLRDNWMQASACFWWRTSQRTAEQTQFLRRAAQRGRACGSCLCAFSLWFYPDVQTVFDEINVQLHALATWRDILSAARALQYFDRATLSEIEKFLDAPAQWSAAHGGI